MDMKNRKKQINIYSISILNPLHNQSFLHKKILSTLKILKSCLNFSRLNLVNPYLYANLPFCRQIPLFLLLIIIKNHIFVSIIITTLIKRIMKRFFIFLLSIFCLFSCTKEGNTPDQDDSETTQEAPRDLDPDQPSFADDNFALSDAEIRIQNGNNVFAFNLLREMLKNETADKNILLSPLSATVALAMLNNGADGITREEIQRGLGFNGIKTEEMNAYLQKILTAMNNTDPRVIFETANSIWIQNGFSVLAPFLEANLKFFDAEARNADLPTVETMNIINAWGAEKTRNTIPKALSQPLPRDIVMLLLNALYFKGPWTIPFEKDMTKDETFSGANVNAKVKMMNLEKDFFYSSEYVYNDAVHSSLKVLELPYGDGNFNMKIILPNKDVSLESVINSLDNPHWDAIRNSLSYLPVKVKLPRFELDYEKVLNKELTALGMKSMFSNANLSLINPVAPLAVSQVFQKTFVKVDEEGTEASAITGVAITTSLQPGKPDVKEFFVDRPFLFVISEKKTGCIFFVGAIRDL
jgi:serpin B